MYEIYAKYLLVSHVHRLSILSNNKFHRKCSPFFHLLQSHLRSIHACTIKLLKDIDFDCSYFILIVSASKYLINIKRVFMYG